MSRHFRDIFREEFEENGHTPVAACCKHIARFVREYTKQPQSREVLFSLLGSAFVREHFQRELARPDSQVTARANQALESNQTLRCELGVASDGSILVTAGPSGLQRGFEIAVSYSDRLCGIAALNRWGFVMPPCAGDSNDGAGKQE